MTKGALVGCTDAEIVEEVGRDVQKGSKNGTTFAVAAMVETLPNIRTEIVFNILLQIGTYSDSRNSQLRGAATLGIDITTGAKLSASL